MSVAMLERLHITEQLPELMLPGLVMSKKHTSANPSWRGVRLTTASSTNAHRTFVEHSVQRQFNQNNRISFLVFSFQVVKPVVTSETKTSVTAVLITSLKPDAIVLNETDTSADDVLITRFPGVYTTKVSALSRTPSKTAEMGSVVMLDPQSLQGTSPEGWTMQPANLLELSVEGHSICIGHMDA